MKYHPISVTLAVAGICLAAVTAEANSGQAVFSNISITPLGTSTLGAMNGAYLDIHAFNDAPSSVNSTTYSYPSITFNEANVLNPTSSGLERDIWYFSNNGGSSPYTFQSGDYFTASFNMTLSGGIPGYDLEGGFLFSNPSGGFGYDDQIVAVGLGNGNAGAIFQAGGPSYYPFSPAAGGYPGKGATLPNYINGQTVSMTFIYTVDPNTGANAFEYAVNGQFAASATGDDYFDFGSGGAVGNPGDYLGGYFQLTPTPEPSTLALLGLGLLPLARRLRRRA